MLTRQRLSWDKGGERREKGRERKRRRMKILKIKETQTEGKRRKEEGSRKVEGKPYLFGANR